MRGCICILLHVRKWLAIARMRVRMTGTIRIDSHTFLTSSETNEWYFVTASSQDRTNVRSTFVGVQNKSQDWCLGPVIGPMLLRNVRSTFVWHIPDVNRNKRIAPWLIFCYASSQDRTNVRCTFVGVQKTPPIVGPILLRNQKIWRVSVLLLLVNTKIDVYHQSLRLFCYGFRRLDECPFYGCRYTKNPFGEMIEKFLLKGLLHFQYLILLYEGYMVNMNVRRWAFQSM
jgi:hypothetical protein